MLPLHEDDLVRDFAFTSQPGKTFRLDIGKNIISGFTDGVEAVKQAVYLALSTERYAHVIYSWNYGAELPSLIGNPIPLVYTKIKEYITDALMQDDRIISVDNFAFERKGSMVHVTFAVGTEDGKIQAEEVVAI